MKSIFFSILSTVVLLTSCSSDDEVIEVEVPSSVISELGYVTRNDYDLSGSVKDFNEVLYEKTQWDAQGNIIDKGEKLNGVSAMFNYKGYALDKQIHQYFIVDGVEKDEIFESYKYEYNDIKTRMTYYEFKEVGFNLGDVLGEKKTYRYDDENKKVYIETFSFENNEDWVSQGVTVVDMRADGYPSIKANAIEEKYTTKILEKDSRGNWTKSYKLYEKYQDGTLVETKFSDYKEREITYY